MAINGFALLPKEIIGSNAVNSRMEISSLNFIFI
jgi:hypothetical protein